MDLLLSRSEGGWLSSRCKGGLHFWLKGRAWRKYRLVTRWKVWRKAWDGEDFLACGGGKVDFLTRSGGEDSVAHGTGEGGSVA